MKKSKFILISIISIYYLFSISCQGQLKKDKKPSAILSEEKIKELTTTLNDVYQKDQEYREPVSATIEKYGVKSKQVNDLFKKMNKADSSNLIIVKSIIKQYGWLGSKVVGSTANTALFIVIQHSPKEDMKYFLPIMRKAVQDSAASKQDLAKMEDRVAVDEGRNQIYGTQIGNDSKTGKYYVLPIENPKEVDKRRAAMGMIPIKSYLIEWGIEWKE